MPDLRNDEVDDDMSRELNTLAAAYALDAVSDDERLLLETHLPEYPELEREIEELRSAAALLAEPVTGMPPARLRQVVLAQLSGIRQLPPIVAAESTRPALAGVSDLAAHRARRAGRLAGWRRSIAVGAVAAAVAAGAVVVGYQSLRPAPSTTSLAAIAASVEARPDVQSTTRPIAGAGTAIVEWSVSGRQAVVKLTSLSKAPTGRTYQLWLIPKAGPAISKGTFGATGPTTQLGVDGLTRGESVGVTVEPAGGSKQPTSRPIVAVPLT